MGRKASGRVVASAIKPAGITLQDWVQGGFGAAPVDLLASRWLAGWGLDLRRFAKDQHLRNAASYRPQGLEIEPVSAADTAAFLVEVWRLLRPSGLSRFEELDRQLLRIGIESLYVAGFASAAAGPAFEAFVDLIVRTVSPPPMSPTWRAYLTRTVLKDDSPIISYAASEPRGGIPEHLCVIARAALLLRLATGIGADVRDRASLGTGELSFWWLTEVQRSGCWPVGSAPANVLDMWADAEAAINSIDTWRSSGAAGDFRALNRSQATALHELAGTERAGVWGLGL
jgi:hypothetical protein